MNRNWKWPNKLSIQEIKDHRPNADPYMLYIHVFVVEDYLNLIFCRWVVEVLVYPTCSRSAISIHICDTVWLHRTALENNINCHSRRGICSLCVVFFCPLCIKGRNKTVFEILFWQSGREVKMIPNVLVKGQNSSHYKFNLKLQMQMFSPFFSYPWRFK